MASARGCRLGGIAGLRSLLDEHAGAVEADLRRYYGANLGDLFTGRTTVRQVIAWVHELPEDSATVRAQEGAERAAWGLNEQLLAAIADLLAWSNYQRAGGAGPRPKPIRRPGVDGSDTKQYGKTDLPPEAVKEILRAYREGRYEQPSDKATTDDGDGGDET